MHSALTCGRQSNCSWNRTEEKCYSQKSQTSQPKYIQQPPFPNFFEPSPRVFSGACPNSICGMQAVMFTQVMGNLGEFPLQSEFNRGEKSWVCLSWLSGENWYWILVDKAAGLRTAMEIFQRWWLALGHCARPIFQTNSIQIRWIFTKRLVVELFQFSTKVTKQEVFGRKEFSFDSEFLEDLKVFVKVSDSEHCEGPHRNATSKSRALYQPLADKFKGSKDTCKRKTTKKGTVGQYWVSK